jgi:hypothetical protein
VLSRTSAMTLPVYDGCISLPLTTLRTQLRATLLKGKMIPHNNGSNITCRSITCRTCQEESLRLMDYPCPALFRVNETEVPDTSNYILKWYEHASPTDISRAYLTVIDDSNREVANKISKPEYILDSGANRHFFNSTVNLHDFKPYMHQMYLSDNRSVPSIGTGDYILVVPSLYVNLISISKLCNDYDYVTLFDKKRALILDRTLLYTTT